MKKFLCLFLTVFATVCFLCGCKKQVNYLDFVSEKRSNIYLYSNDGFEIKIHISERETPYSTDGIKGDMSGFTEIFVTLPKNYDEVEISVADINGEMNYKAVENCYYLSLSGGNISGDSVKVTLSYNGESTEYTAVSVLYDGVISCDDAVKCVIDHNEDLFKSLTQRDIFLGEIFVRLLYDEGCYYYVGVCDRDKKITACLVDGERGNIIATKELG
ncbi:MAG: hypothetical protein K2N23_02160 [Clostridia bacterium]|nr:hypothetical protein [Clostridia bacterium]